MKNFMALLILLVLGANVTEGRAQVAVVVNKANPIAGMRLRELRDIYLGKMVSWPDNKKIVAVSQRSRNEISRIFYEIGLGKKFDAIQRIWIKISLSGQATPPKTLATDEEVLEYVAANERAIGFVDFKSVNRKVKVLKINGKEPWQKGYPLKK